MQLTEHQRKILKLLRSGLSSSEAAKEAGVSYWAVKSVVAIVRKKYNVSTQEKLIKTLQGVDLDTETKRTKITGVYLSEWNSWLVYIYIKRRSCYLGSYQSRRKAIEVLNQAIKMRDAGSDFQDIKRTFVPKRPDGNFYKTEHGKWRARIYIKRKYIDLGYYTSEKEARATIIRASELKQQGHDAQTIKAMALNAKPQ